MGLLVIRVLAPLIGIAILWLVRTWVKPPATVWRRALELGWVAAAVVAVADTAARLLGFWHYTMPGLVAGLPLDLYVAVALIYGSSLLLVYWWLREKNPRYGLLLAGALPFYGVARDAVVTSLSGTLFLAWDTPYWWAPNFIAWAAMGWITIFAFDRSLFGHRQQHDSDLPREAPGAAAKHNRRFT
jgi:hypothetical protein